MEVLNSYKLLIVSIAVAFVISTKRWYHHFYLMNEYHGHPLTLMTTWTEIFLILLTAVTASVTGITNRDYFQQVFFLIQTQ